MIFSLQNGKIMLRKDPLGDGKIHKEWLSSNWNVARCFEIFSLFPERFSLFQVNQICHIPLEQLRSVSKAYLGPWEGLASQEAPRSWNRYLCWKRKAAPKVSVLVRSKPTSQDMGFLVAWCVLGYMGESPHLFSVELNSCYQSDHEHMWPWLPINGKERLAFAWCV